MTSNEVGHDQPGKLSPIFARGPEHKALPSKHFPEEVMLPSTAYQLIHDEVMLDGNARLNFATFVTTWMDDSADRLYAETYDKNMIDKDEYPKTAEIEQRCWQLLGDLWNAPDVDDLIGTSTVGSSEACMLGGLAMKRRWQQARKKDGKDTSKPNMVMSSAVQVVWEKFCNYWDVEARFVPISAEYPCLSGAQLASVVDENTIGVVAIMGVTYTGVYEPVAEICSALDAIKADTGLDIPVHVDAASGGFITPFLQPDIVWDFRLERVHSISASGHKYGLVYPGVGWVVWRSQDLLPEDLIFKVSYLGGSMPTFALNFSRPGAQVLLQYFNFLHLGRAGYTAVQQSSSDVAKHLADGIAAMPDFTVIADGSDIPLVAWQLKGTKIWTLRELSSQLRSAGFLVPAYPLPDNLSDQWVMRVVVRNGVTTEMMDDLLIGMAQAVQWLNKLEHPLPPTEEVHYHH